MIKSELVKRISLQNPHLYQRDIKKIVNVIFGEIVEALRRGDRVELRGFEAFSAKLRGARQGRNPRTGSVVAVAKKAVPFFKRERRCARGLIGKPCHQIEQLLSYARCAGSSGSRSQSPRSCSPQSAAHRSPLLASPVWWSGQGSRPGLASRCIRTCYGTPAAMPWPTGGTTRGRYKPISVTKTSSIRYATPSYRRCGSRISGGLERLTRQTSPQTDSSDRSRCPIALPDRLAAV